MPTVLLVRHGQASLGGEDYDVLSPAGRRQAELLAAALERRGVAPARLVSGSLRRQLETAAAFAAHGEPVVDERWDEYDANDILSHHSESLLRLEAAGEAGEVTNSSFQAALEPALGAWVEMADSSPAAVSWPRFSAAGAAALADLAAELGRGETAVVVTSGGTIAALTGTLLGVADATFAALGRVVVNTGVTKVAIGAGGTNLVSFNDHSHLEDADRALITYR